MSDNLTFDGTQQSWMHLLRGRQKPPFAPLRRNFISIYGMPGAHLADTETDLLTIRQPVGFKIKDDEDALAKKDELAAWLVRKKWASLEFDDEPDRVYQALVENTIDDFEKFVDLRQGTITFTCLPFAESKTEKTAPLNEQFEYKGTEEAFPVVTVNFTDTASSFDISNQEDFMVKINYDFGAGDELVLDFETEKITINGNVQQTALAWKVSDWFSIKPGNNLLTSSQSAEVIYKERWK